LGWSKKSPEVAMKTPSRTTRVTLSSDPKCCLAAARALKAAVWAASRPASVSSSFPSRPITSVCDPRPAACRSRRAGCPSAAPRRNCQTASVRLATQYQGPSTGALPRPAANLYRSPPAYVCTVVHVQHLPGYVARFRQINNSLSDVLRLGDRSHR
jgi:hypothetical protein